MVAREKEYAIVHLLNRYRTEVGKLLRKELGSFYGDWEVMEDERTLPTGLIS